MTAAAIWHDVEHGAYDAAVNHVNAAEAKATGLDEVQLSLTHAKVEVQRQLDEILQPRHKQSHLDF